MLVVDFITKLLLKYPPLALRGPQRRIPGIENPSLIDYFSTKRSVCNV